MDPKPVPILRTFSRIEIPPSSSSEGDLQETEEDDPFSLSSSSIALFGLLMAIAVVGVPLVAVLTERPLGKKSLMPTALESDGSKPSLPISLSGVGQSNS